MTDDQHPPGAFSHDYWEDRYRNHGGHDAVPDPSPQLVAEVGDLASGRALEAGCGEGGNAVWLSTQRWQVTAVDVSATAVQQAREHAASRGAEIAGRITWLTADLADLPLEEDGFDLVTAHYVHPSGPYEELVRRLAEDVAPGGVLLVVGHDPADAHSRDHAPGHVAFTARELAQLLDEDTWEIEVTETRTREVSEHGMLMHDSVLRASRRL